MALTPRRSLRSGRPLWFHYRARLPRAAILHRDRRTEVLIVGAGISGVLLSQQLAERGHQVVLVDRRGALCGSTSASTALLQHEIDVPLIHLRRAIGRSAAEHAWHRSQAALQALAALSQRHHWTRTLRENPTLYLAGAVLDASGLRREAIARQRIGLPADYLGRRALRAHFGLARAAAIFSRGNWVADPRQLTAAMLRTAVSQGVRLYAPCDIVEIHAGRRTVLARSAHGPCIEAQQLVFCTGYEPPSLVPQDHHRVSSTWVMATAAQPAMLWPQQCSIWEAADPYLYVRTTQDGHVICGGEDEPIAAAVVRDAMNEQKTACLSRKLQRLFPQLDARPSYAWSGCFWQSDTGLPSIGAVPGQPRCHAVLGFGGNGITFSMLAAQLLSQALAGRRDPDAALFAFPS